MLAPNITGIDIKNENLIAALTSKPLKSTVEIVAQEREMPGRIAKA